MLAVHRPSAMERTLGFPLAIELFAELPDQLPLRPGQPIVFDRHGEHSLFTLTVPLDVIDGPPLAAIPLRMPSHRCTSRRQAA